MQRNRPAHDRPCAARGLVSYRALGTYGWIMIGAVDDADAHKKAARSVSRGCYTRLDRWSDVTGAYEPIWAGETK